MKSSKGEQKIQPVLMTPLRRCGSHALRLRFNFISDFYSPYPLHICDLMPLLPLYGDLSNDSKYFQLVADVIGLQSASLVKWPGVTFEPVHFFEKIKDKPRSVHVVVNELLIEAAKAHGARVVMDKSLDSVHYWPEIMKVYPEMLFLNVVRDPRAQISSMNKAIIYEFDTLLNTQIWVRAYEAAEKLKKAHPSRVLTIRFEDFIENEEQILKEICNFLGLQFKSEIMDISRSEEAKRISTQSALWESNHLPPERKNIDKFKKSLSESEIECIETLTAPYLRIYDYQPTTSAQFKLGDTALKQAHQQSDEKKRLAWAELKKKNPQDYILRKKRADYIESCRLNLLKKEF